jgi:transposase
MKRASMEKVSIIGLDLAKRRLQAHGARADGGVAFRKTLSRDRVLAFLAERPRCVVAMEACGSAHHWGRAIGALGHEVRLIAPDYVKPFGAPRRRVLPVEEGSTQRIVDSSGS